MNVLVTGGASGLGKEICKALLKQLGKEALVTVIDKNPKAKKLPGTEYHFCDVSNEAEVCGVKSYIGRRPIDVLINCAGVNTLSLIANMTSSIWEKTMRVNAEAILVMAQTFLDDLVKQQGTILNVVSNASRMPMTHSIAYNASKAAAAMMTKQMARELTSKYGITVFGINPNKLEDTGMSKEIETQVCKLRGWTIEEAKEYQLKALPAGFETKPEWIAELVAWLLAKKERHQYLTGCLLDLGGP